MSLRSSDPPYERGCFVLQPPLPDSSEVVLVWAGMLRSTPVLNPERGVFSRMRGVFQQMPSKTGRSDRFSRTRGVGSQLQEFLGLDKGVHPYARGCFGDGHRIQVCR